jgi:hypothetical protein
VNDGVRNGTAVAQNCIDFSANRTLSNYDIASKAEKPGRGGEAISRAQAAFCASLSEYTDGSWVKGDCDTWNRARGELVVLGLREATSSAKVSAKIREVESDRRRFCQSLLNAGNPGADATAFAVRMGACFSLVKLETATDRAIFLGDF